MKSNLFLKIVGPWVHLFFEMFEVIDEKLKAITRRDYERKISVFELESSIFQSQLDEMHQLMLRFRDFRDLNPHDDLKAEKEVMRAKHDEYLQRIEQHEVKITNFDDLKRRFEEFEQNAKVLICSRNLPADDCEALKMLENMRKQVANLKEERRRHFMR